MVIFFRSSGVGGVPLFTRCIILPKVGSAAVEACNSFKGTLASPSICDSSGRNSSAQRLYTSSISSVISSMVSSRSSKSVRRDRASANMLLLPDLKRSVN